MKVMAHEPAKTYLREFFKGREHEFRGASDAKVTQLVDESVRAMRMLQPDVVIQEPARVFEDVATEFEGGSS